MHRIIYRRPSFSQDTTSTSLSPQKICSHLSTPSAIAGVLSVALSGTLQAQPQVVRIDSGQPATIEVRWQPYLVPATGGTVPATGETAPAPARIAQADILDAEPGQPAADPNTDPADRDRLEVPINPDDDAEQPAPAPVPPDAPEESVTPEEPATPEAQTDIDDPTVPTAPRIETAPSASPPIVSGPSLRPSEVEGRQIAGVRIVGNRVIGNEAILLQVQGTRPGFAFSPTQAERDRARIDALGFFASVEYQVLPNIEDTNRVDVVFAVVENRVVTGYEFPGNTIIPQEELEAVLKTRQGAVLNRNEVNTDVESIQKLFRQRGYAILVTDVRQDEKGAVVYTISFATISQIVIEGNDKTDESLIRQQIRTEPGETFNELELRQDLNRIFDMGFFEDINFRVDPDPEEPGALIVTIVVVERRTGSLSVGVGFDSRSKISGFVSVSENNFQGSGRRVGASLELGSQRTYSLNFGDPFVGEKNASYDVAVYSRRFYREPRRVQLLTGTATTSGTFEEQRTGGRLNYSQPLDLDRNRTVLFGYRNESVKLLQTDAQTGQPLTELDSSGRTSALSLGFVRDRRDLRLDPSRGGREQIIVEKGFSLLGGDNNFTKLDLDLRRYIPIVQSDTLGEQPKLVLAGRIVAGQSIGRLPAFEQYFVGGPDTVRGYNTDEQYGDNQIFSNLELRYRIKRQFQIVAFVDAGSAYGGSFSQSNSTDFLVSAGAGVRLQTPIGPVRLDIGFGRDGAKTHFAIGPTF